jgi:hypothetical protein
VSPKEPPSAPALGLVGYFGNSMFLKVYLLQTFENQEEGHYTYSLILIMEPLIGVKIFLLLMRRWDIPKYWVPSDYTRNFLRVLYENGIF